MHLSSSVCIPDESQMLVMLTFSIAAVHPLIHLFTEAPESGIYQLLPGLLELLSVLHVFTLASLQNTFVPGMLCILFSLITLKILPWEHLGGLIH